MAILVDRPLWWHRGERWCHCVSDVSYDELHDFVEGLGIPRRAFQGDHYDLPERYWAAAIAAGAELVDSRVIVGRLRAADLRLRPSRKPGLARAQPRRIAPMKATPGTLPIGPEWCYELKWDGMRAICTIEQGRARATSARDNDITASFPELQQLAATLPLDVVVDGELVALDRGHPSFQLLQQRIHVTDPVVVARRARDVPVVYVIFDLLRVGEDESTALPLAQRRALLEELIEPGPTWRLTEVHDGDGQALFDVIVERGLEGIVAKRLDAPYEEGRRSPAWVKVKATMRQEMVVGGWLSGEGSGRSDRIGSLLVGYHDATGLRFAGSVGSGLSEREAARLLERLAPLETEPSPFVDAAPSTRRRRATFVKPRLVVEVAFTAWTEAGHLRHPVFMGERVDIEPEAVGRER